MGNDPGLECFGLIEILVCDALFLSVLQRVVNRARQDLFPVRRSLLYGLVLLPVAAILYPAGLKTERTERNTYRTRKRGQGRYVRPRRR